MGAKSDLEKAQGPLRALLAPVLLALILLMSMRLGAFALRSPNPGMVENPCPRPDDGLLEKLRLTALVIGGEAPILEDWTGQCRYARENARMRAAGLRPDTVFIGDSITAEWVAASPGLFDGKQVVGRGVGSHTSEQVLVRFMSDVVALHPRRVHLMVGLNDTVGMMGLTSPQRYKDNIRAMVQLARVNGIEVVIGAITPSAERPGLARELNRWLADFAAREGIGFIDYHTPLASADGALREGMARDRVHLTPAAYAVMDKLAARAINN